MAGKRAALDTMFSDTPESAPGTEVVKTVSRAERLSQLARTIDSAQSTHDSKVVSARKQLLAQVAPALREIRDDELHKEVGYDTFEEYVKVKWGYSRPHAYMIMSWVPVTEALVSGIPDTPMSRIDPTDVNLEVVRTLAPIQNEHGDDAVRNVWAKASESGRRVTGAKLKTAAVTTGYSASRPQLPPAPKRLDLQAEAEAADGFLTLLASDEGQAVMRANAPIFRDLLTRWHRETGRLLDLLP